MNPIDGWVGKLGGDGGHLLPSDCLGYFPDGQFGDKVGSGCPVTPVKDVKMIVYLYTVTNFSCKT
jgi:hypothetical protein